MKLVCAPESFRFEEDGALNVQLYAQPTVEGRRRAARGGAGAAARTAILRAGYHPAPRAWDFLSIALAVVTADLAVHRRNSADGWTRDIDLTVAVGDPEFWNSQAPALEQALKFLSTDRWQLRFVGGGLRPARPRNLVLPTEDCAVLLSGGLDSLVGTLDLAAKGHRPIAVSNIVRGDGANQVSFAGAIAGGLRHLALNHNAAPPWAKEESQRARSLIFIAFGLIGATALRAHHEGRETTLYVCENGFISINPPLTGARLGSLSTRTAHPEFLNRIREILVAAELRVRLVNPYEHKTKGEMMVECRDQALLKMHAASSVSCGRYRVFNYKHCGRCVPCHVRRAAFLAWGEPDTTFYVYESLGKPDADHAGFDDVRSVAMALAQVRSDGLDAWLGPALAYPRIGDAAPLRALIGRGLDELGALHQHYGVR